MHRLVLLLILLCASPVLNAQYEIEYLGLDDQTITAFDINYGIAAIGTDRAGVFWQFESLVEDSGWTHIPIDSLVLAVYPHTSGPLGWAISIGVGSAKGQPPYVFCSEMGGDVAANSAGMMPSLTPRVSDLDGFPDPSVCGETFAAGGRAVYRRYYGDTTWQAVFTATIEGAINTVKVRQSHPGTVMLGGADGFAGFLMARSSDFGETWQDISPPGMVFGIDFGGANADTIFAAASHVIFRSFDGGVTWETVFLEGIELHISEILYLHEQGMVYAAGRQNVMDDAALLLASNDLGQNWDVVPLPDLTTINGLEAGSDEWIYVSTHLDGVYRLRAGTTSTTDAHDRVNAGPQLRIFPNPVERQIRCQYVLVDAGPVVLDLYNIDGHPVARIEDAIRSAGTHDVQWEASALPAGVYVATLATGGRTMSAVVIIQ